MDTETVKDSKKKKDKRVGSRSEPIVRCWEDEQENAEREEQLHSLARNNITESKKRLPVKFRVSLLNFFFFFFLNKIKKYSLYKTNTFQVKMFLTKFLKQFIPLMIGA